MLSFFDSSIPNCNQDVGTWDQCDQIGLFLKYFGNKIGPNIKQFWGYFEKPAIF